MGIEILLIGLAILGVICTWRMIGAAFRLGNRTTVATEATAAALQALYDSLSDEAKHRTTEVQLARAQHNRLVARQAYRRRVLVIVIGLAVVLVIAAMRNARADDMPAQMLGTWCQASEPDARPLVYAPREPNEQCRDDTLIIRADGYDGTEYGCRFTSVRVRIDHSIALATKTPGAPVAQTRATCTGEGNRWNERVTLYFSKGLLFLRERHR